MHDYDVLLGVDCAARDTGMRMRLRVRESNALSAALVAEQTADQAMDDPRAYTHAMRVRAVPERAVAAALPVAA